MYTCVENVEVLLAEFNGRSCDGSCADLADTIADVVPCSSVYLLSDFNYRLSCCRKTVCYRLYCCCKAVCHWLNCSSETVTCDCNVCNFCYRLGDLAVDEVVALCRKTCVVLEVMHLEPEASEERSDERSDHATDVDEYIEDLETAISL